MLDLTKENFEAEVLKAEGKVFVDFYGDGCGRENSGRWRKPSSPSCSG